LENNNNHPIEQNQVPPQAKPADKASKALSESQPSKTTQTTAPTPTTDPEAPEPTMNTNQRIMHALNLLEAALYVAGRPLDINEMCQAVGSRSKKKVIGYAEMLMEQYKARNSSIEILALKDERYVLQVKSEYTPLIKKLVNRPLLSSGPLKTLSYIAYRQPITQKRVIEVRGQHAYGHVKLLKDMDLIKTEQSGRSLALKTTDYFADYFGLTQDTTVLKRDLRKIFGSAIKEDAFEKGKKAAEEENKTIEEINESESPSDQ
jgi:segregation and condensation protein B